MGKTKFLLGALGLMTLGFASCSSDEPLGYQNETVEADMTQYLSVAISTPTNYMSRAEGENFDDGTTDESYVHQLMFVFYDGSGAPTAESISYNKDDEDDPINTGWTDVNKGENVTRFWTSTIPVNMTQGQNKPVYVMCFVNPIDNSNLTRMTLSEIDALERTAYYTDGHGFAMSNSVYYGDNPITGQSNVRVMATPITDGQLYATEAEAAAAPALDIYVERYAAKIGLTLPNTAGTIKPYDVLVAGADGLTEGSITFTPAYWRANAVDLTCFVTKAFNTTALGSDRNVPATYTAMNAAFANSGMPGSGLTGWNDATNYRSYWACSPSYYSEDYPQCSDDITDVAGSPVVAANYPYDVKYYSYNECAAEGSNAIAWNNGFSLINTGAKASGYIYTRETTASNSILTKEGINNKAVPASAIIVGNYQLTGSTGTPTTFYLYGKSAGKDVYYTNANIEQALIANQNVIFTNQTGTTRATSVDFFEVKHPSKAVRDGQNVAGRLVTIQINEETLPDTPLYFYDGEDFVRITTENVVAANQLLWASASTAQKFHNGLAFFAIPIRHLGWGKNVEPGKELLSDPETTSGRPSMINWQNLRVGDLGVVRNHVYTIEVTGISGLGVGLENADQPMVPPMDPDNYYIAAKLNILAWRVVPKQTVTL